MSKGYYFAYSGFFLSSSYYTGYAIAKCNMDIHLIWLFSNIMQCLKSCMLFCIVDEQKLRNRYKFSFISIILTLSYKTGIFIGNSILLITDLCDVCDRYTKKKTFSLILKYAGDLYLQFICSLILLPFNGTLFE